MNEDIPGVDWLDWPDEFHAKVLKNLVQAEEFDWDQSLMTPQEFQFDCLQMRW